jgi:hypothetical protein
MELWEVLRDIQTKLDVHLAEEAIYRPQVLEAIETMRRTKGVIAFFRFIVYIFAPVGGAILWLRDHIHL